MREKFVYRFKKVGNKEIAIGIKKMNKLDVKSYFNLLRRDKKNEIRLSGTYCERCGISIGKQYNNKKKNVWKGFVLCDRCYKYKKSSQPELTPDLEDIERFKIYE